ncbi:polymer-forming cytoskeletal protein [Paenibacillus oenotherae]|uniref:Polymer-forming cytoskeletal protein n=1 Tax=Paenibacillus oenotherae TaxID=1435645 RepID=A0ABS7DAX5_9BACL|nr:polymer-forming cytoskeletal protein [Paenibacillus oenotherae]MBW7476751.1 polymer-forming cytoskeletal protein [Paenibacillus oenotherae]
MFKDNKRPAAKTDTLIGQGTHMEGKMISEAGIRIEGEYWGDIECRSEVIVGECGIAKSSITASDVTIAGKIYGDIATKGRLTITATGQLHGNATVGMLLIQEGGQLNGTCRMERTADAKPRGSAGTESQQSKDGANKEKALQAG